MAKEPTGEFNSIEEELKALAFNKQQAEGATTVGELEQQAEKQEGTAKELSDWVDKLRETYQRVERVLKSYQETQTEAVNRFNTHWEHYGEQLANLGIKDFDGYAERFKDKQELQPLEEAKQLYAAEEAALATLIDELQRTRSELPELPRQRETLAAAREVTSHLIPAYDAAQAQADRARQVHEQALADQEQPIAEALERQLREAIYARHQDTAFQLDNELLDNRLRNEKISNLDRDIDIPEHKKRLIVPEDIRDAFQLGQGGKEVVLESLARVYKEQLSDRERAVQSKLEKQQQVLKELKDNQSPTELQRKTREDIPKFELPRLEIELKAVRANNERLSKLITPRLELDWAELALQEIDKTHPVALYRKAEAEWKLTREKAQGALESFEQEVQRQAQELFGKDERAQGLYGKHETAFQQLLTGTTLIGAPSIEKGHQYGVTHLKVETNLDQALTEPGKEAEYDQYTRVNNALRAVSGKIKPEYVDLTNSYSTVGELLNAYQSTLKEQVRIPLDYPLPTIEEVQDHKAWVGQAMAARSAYEAVAPSPRR